MPDPKLYLWYGLRRPWPHAGREFTLVLWLQGLSISEYLVSRDPVSGTVYYVMLGVFCIMPLLVAPR